MAPRTLIVISGVGPLDDIFSITLKSGEFVVWNVTKLNRAAKAGAFGPPRYARTCDLPPAEWKEWTAEDRAIVDGIKQNPKALDEPVIAIGSDRPGFLINCFADGQHRITARQELCLPEIAFYLVPPDVERRFRVHGIPPGV